MAGAQEDEAHDGGDIIDVVLHGSSRGLPPPCHHHQPLALARRRRVLLFPLPFQGHIDPMLHLADVLHGRGLDITVLHTRFNALDPSRYHPSFRFVPVEYDYYAPPAADVAATGKIIDIILVINAAMDASPSALLHALLLASSSSTNAASSSSCCLFIDANLLAVQRAAREIGMPTLVLRTGSAACFGCFLAYPMLHDKGYLPPEPSKLHEPVPELPPLRVRDLIYTRHSDHELVRRVLARACETVRACSGLVVNTCEALEEVELSRLRDELAAGDDHIPVILAAGPLHKHKLSSSSSSRSSGGGGGGGGLMAPDQSCVEWLDAQPAASVLYVSFGSLAAMESTEFVELAWGLAQSGHRFLWVVRPDQVRRRRSNSDDGETVQRLPEGFEEAVEGRGKVVRWAPQREVLAHRAVGGFWTHCGWNSTLEAVGEGVPMMCRPDAIDQMMNARYVQEVWGVGFEIEGEMERGVVRDAVRKMMSGEGEGAEMRRRARELRGRVEACLERSAGGSSQVAVDELVEYILSL